MLEATLVQRHHCINLCTMHQRGTCIYDDRLISLRPAPSAIAVMRRAVHESMWVCPGSAVQFQTLAAYEHTTALLNATACWRR